MIKRFLGLLVRVLPASRGQLDRLTAVLEATLPDLRRKVDGIEVSAATAARRVVVACGPDDVLVRTEVGYVVCAASDHALIAFLLEGGAPEPGTRQVIQRLLGPGDVFVDVGANIGLHTLAAVRALRGEGRVVAFEPFGPTRRCLEMGLALNGLESLVDVRGAAASNRTGTQALHLGGTSGHHSLYDLNRRGASATVEVELVTLDGALGADARVDLVKIDAEGAELDVLEGGAGVLRHNRDVALIVEFGPSHLRRIGQQPDGWLARFEAMGFEYRAIDEKTGRLVDLGFDELAAIDSINLMFARPGSPAWAKADAR